MSKQSGEIAHLADRDDELERLKWMDGWRRWQRFGSQRGITCTPVDRSHSAGPARSTRLAETHRPTRRKQWTVKGKWCGWLTDRYAARQQL